MRDFQLKLWFTATIIPANCFETHKLIATFRFSQHFGSAYSPPTKYTNQHRIKAEIIPLNLYEVKRENYVTRVDMTAGRLSNSCRSRFFIYGETKNTANWTCHYRTFKGFSFLQFLSNVLRHMLGTTSTTKICSFFYIMREINNFEDDKLVDLMPNVISPVWIIDYSRPQGNIITA